MQQTGHAATYLLNMLLHQLQSNKQKPPSFAHLCCFWCKTYCTHVPKIIEVLFIGTRIKIAEDKEVQKDLASRSHRKTINKSPYIVYLDVTGH